MAAPSRGPDARPDDKRERILRAAQEIAEREGVAAARMEEVAALAQVSKGTLYRFFESKEDLFLAMMLAAYDDALRRVEPQMDATAPAAERLATYLDGLTQVLTTVSSRMNVHYQAWGVVAKDRVLQERLFGFLREFHRRRSQVLEEIIRDGQREGIHPQALDVRALCDGVAAMLSGFLYRATFDPHGASPEALRACFEALVARALREPAGPA